MRVTTKGQVTIPLKIRKMLNIMPASEVDFFVRLIEGAYPPFEKIVPSGFEIIKTFKICIKIIIRINLHQNWS